MNGLLLETDFLPSWQCNFLALYNHSCFCWTCFCKDFGKTRAWAKLWRTTCRPLLSDGCHHTAAVSLQEPCRAMMEYARHLCTVLSDKCRTLAQKILAQCPQVPQSSTPSTVSFLHFASQVFLKHAHRQLFFSHTSRLIYQEKGNAYTGIASSYFTKNFPTKTYFLTWILEPTGSINSDLQSKYSKFFDSIFIPNIHSYAVASWVSHSALLSHFNIHPDNAEDVFAFCSTHLIPQVSLSTSLCWWILWDRCFCFLIWSSCF